MGNLPKLFDITKKIKNIYSRLYELEKSNKVDLEYYSVLEILQDVLIKEDKIYKCLTEKDANYFVNYYMLRNIYPEKGYGVNSLDFKKIVDDNDLDYDRIAIRIGIYTDLSQLGDNNWYQKLCKGVYLTDNTDVSKETDYYYYLIYSSYSIVNFFKNTISDEYYEDDTFLNRYITSFINPFTESFLVKSNFKIDNNYDYILKINNYNNKFDSYKNAAIVYYENHLRNFVENVMYGKIKELDAYFIDKLIELSSFIEIIDTEMREYIYLKSVDLYRMAKTEPNICTNYYFDLFSTLEFVNDESDDKKLKKEY